MNQCHSYYYRRPIINHYHSRNHHHQQQQGDDPTQLPHRDDGVQVWPDPFSVGREEIGFSRHKVGVLNDRFHLYIDVIKLVLSVDVRYVASVQNIVEVFQKSFAFDLQYNTQTTRRWTSA